MSQRIVIGPRTNGDVGIFIAQPGDDAMTASDSSLILNVSSKVSQLLLMGRTTIATTVALGLAHSPFVFVTSQFDFAGVTGHTLGPGPLRPSPQKLTGAVPATATINSGGASMSVSLSSNSSGGPYPTVYQVYNQAFA